MIPNDFRRIEYGWQTRRRLPFLNRRLKITIIPECDGAEPTIRQLQVLESLEPIPPEFIDGIDDYVTAHRRRYMNVISRAIRAYSWLTRFLRITSGSDMNDVFGTGYEITEIVIPQLEATPNQYFFLNAECDWDDEHGLEILVRDGTVVHCGMQEMPYFIGSEWLKYIS